MPRHLYLSFSFLLCIPFAAGLWDKQVMDRSFMSGFIGGGVVVLLIMGIVYGLLVKDRLNRK
jgi:hypothetical protein